MGKRSIRTDTAAAWNTAMKAYRREKRFTKKDLDEMKADYVAKYGYTIAVPGFNDIIHWKHPAAMSEEELKDQKRKRLQQILASPTPEWGRSYSSIMTWLDDIQDAMTTSVVAASLLIRWMPKIMSRFIPYVGWAMLAYDVMNLMNTLGRAPMTALSVKRRACEIIRDNPTLKQRAMRNAENIKIMKPSFGNLLEVLQTLDNVAGVGLSLGSAMGFIQDMAFGAYKSLSGEDVKVKWTMPKQEIDEFMALKSKKATAMIQSAGQTFDDELHFWTYVTNAGSDVIVAPYIQEADMATIIDAPMTTILPAPAPTDPITLAVIAESGLDVEKGRQWPVHEGKEISLDELTDWQAPRIRESFQNFMQRHKQDWYGFVAACMTSQGNNMIFDAMDPGADVEESYTPAVHVLLQMTKRNTWLQPIPTPEQFKPFEDWCNSFLENFDSYPDQKEIRNKLDLLQIPWTQTQPMDYPSEVQELFPPDVLDETTWEATYED